MIKAIQTKYDGYLFRSRLEARWAVFFNEAGIEYKYEPEGFELNYNGYYLPDFYLPKFNSWIEIKPMPEKSRRGHWADRAPDETRKIIELSMMFPSGYCIISFGDPLEQRGSWYKNGLLIFPDCAIDVCDDKLFPTAYEGGYMYGFNGKIQVEFGGNRAAAIAARSARFEHGANGVINE